VNSLLAGIGPADVHNRDPRDLLLISAGTQVIGDGVLAKAEHANILFCQLAPWQFGGSKQSNLKRTYRRVSFLVSRLLANMGVSGSTILSIPLSLLGGSRRSRKTLAGQALPQ